MNKVEVKVRVEILAAHPNIIDTIKLNLEKAGFTRPLIEHRVAHIAHLEYTVSVRPRRIPP